MKIKGRFAPLTEELGDDERFIIQSTDLDKLMYILIIYTCTMTRHKAPINPNYYKKRYGLRSKTGQIAASLGRIRDMYPKLSWGEKSLSLINSATYRNQILTEEDKEEETEQEKEKGTSNEFDALGAFQAAFKLYPNQNREGFARSAFFAFRWDSGLFTRFQQAQAKYQEELAANDWRQPMEFSRFIGEWQQWENHVVRKEKKYASRSDQLIAKIAGK